MIFISHSSKDKAAALDFQRRLIEYGYDKSQLFLDSDAETGIPAGSKWEKMLYSRLKNCRALIVLCSGNWRESRWCFAELVFAKAMGKEIFPLLLEECSVDPVVAEHQTVLVYKEGEAAYARLWDALDTRHLGPRDDFGWPPKEGDDCPFPGLPAFDESLAGVYFGRELETQSILEELRKMRANGEPRLLMIVGGSGSGKSSLLKAGVLPRLKRKTSDTEWVILPTLRYGEKANEQRTVFDQLAVSLAAIFPEGAKSTPDWKLLTAEISGENLQRAVEVFVKATQDLTYARKYSNATVLIAIDQFEELLTPSAGPTAAQFLRFLKRLLNCSNGQLLMIGTMRSDHLDIYEKSSGALQAPFFQPWRLGPFPPERIEDVIRKPISRTRLEITPELVERLKRDTPTAEALPLLAFTLEKLYRGCSSHGKLELQDYVSLGGMEGSIQTFVERIIPPNSLSTSDASALRLAFVKHLAQVNDKGEVVRLTARWDDLPEAVKPLLHKFVNQRLLTRSESKVTEVAHEAMFRCWRDLKEWLRTSTDILRWRRDVRRDQADDPKWTGLRPAQLAVARDWPKRRREELTAEEVKWIKKGILSERIRLGVVAGVVLVVSLLAGIALLQTNEAKRQQGIANENAHEEKIARELADDQAKIANERLQTAQAALTDDFFRSIGNSHSDIPERDEREALWELAQLDGASATVRNSLLNLWFRTLDSFNKGVVRDGEGFRAAAGLNPEYLRLIKSNASTLGRSVAGALENPEEKPNSDRDSRLGKGLEALATKMEPQAAAEIAKGLVSTFENTQLKDANDLKRLTILSGALETLAYNMEPQAAAEIVKGLGATLENPHETFSEFTRPNKIEFRGEILVALANQIQPDAAPEIAKSLAAALENPQDTSYDKLSEGFGNYRIKSLADSLVVLADKLEPQVAAEIARGIAAALENQEISLDRIISLRDAFVALAKKMRPQPVTDIAKGLVSALEDPRETNSERLASLGAALAVLANKMDPQAAAEIARRSAQRLTTVFKNLPETDETFLSVGQALTTLANKMQPNAAAEIGELGVQRIAAALENAQKQTDETDYDSFSKFDVALAPLANKIRPQVAAEIAKSLVAGLQNPQVANDDSFSRPNKFSILGDALTALANQMEPQAAAGIAKRLAGALEYDTGFDRLSSISDAFVAVANRIQPQAAAEIAKDLASALENPREGSFDRLFYLGDALGALANKVEPRAWAEITKGLALALENLQANSSDKFPELAYAIAVLPNMMQAQAWAEIAKVLASALENPEEDPATLRRVGYALAAVANKMQPEAAAEIAKGLASALENPLEAGPDRLASLSYAFGAVANRMQLPPAAEIAKGLASALENPQKSNSDKLSVLGENLAALCKLFPFTPRTHLLALSHMLLRPISKGPSEDKLHPNDGELLAHVCAQLSPQYLAMVLKFPFCTGEAEHIVLGQLEAKTGRHFAADVGKIVEQANSLGIKDIDSPAKRPSVQEALDELAALTKS